MFGENHAHIFMNSINYRQAVQAHQDGVNEAVLRAHLQAYQEAGVTFVRDGGDGLHVSERAREIAEEYGIAYRTPLFAIHKNGHYGKIVGNGFDTLKEYAALVKQVKNQGGDFIKIMTTGIMDFSTDGSITEAPLLEAEVREMVHIAHEEGFAVMAHTNGNRAVQEAVLAGVDSIEHGNYVEEETMRLMAEKRVVWVPTVTVVRNLMQSSRFSQEVLAQIWGKSKENIQKAYHLGVVLALGSDAGAYLVPHGQGIRDEWNCFCEILKGEPDLVPRLLEGENIIRKKFKKI